MKLGKKDGANKAQTSAQKQLFLGAQGSSGDTAGSVPPPPLQYVSPRDKKRLKKVEEKEATKSPVKNRAASQGEDCQAQ